MPYVLSPIINENSPGMWYEGYAYEKKNIYSLKSGKMPPVNYDEHTIRPHSLTHLETPAHTLMNGNKIDYFYQNNQNHFFGSVIVIKLKGNNYLPKENGIFHWVISPDQIQERLKALKIQSPIKKLLISTEIYYKNEEGYHDPNFVLTLSQEAADFLVSNPNFDLYGTSWKSSDFNPGKSERPIHNTIFKKALILENLDLKNVPEGTYFLSAFPLPLKDASESPVVPILFTQEELTNSF